MKAKLFPCLCAVLVLAALPALAQNPSFTEEFEDITTLPGDGWINTNMSSPLGSTSWFSSKGPLESSRTVTEFQGNTSVFPAYSSAGYIADNYNACGDGTISDWLFTPEVTFIDGDTFSFWTRGTGGTWPDRLELRLSIAGGSTDVGADEFSVGDFTEVLIEVNPTLAVGGYPDVWTQYVATITGHPAVESGRFAFRYFVTDGGPSGSASDYIGVDLVEFTSSTPVELQSFSVE